MQETQRPSGGTTTATQPSNELLVAALQHLYLAYQKTTIYPEGHPSVPAALDLAVCGLAGLLRDGDSVRLAIGRDAISIDGERIEERTGVLGTLAELLHGLDVAAVELRHGIDRAQLRAFVLALGQARREELRGKQLVELLASKQLEHLELAPLDYDAFAFTEGAREPGEGAPAPDAWDALGATLTDASPDALPIAPEQFAREVDQDLREGSGIEEVRARIGKLSRDIDAAPPDRRRSGRDWISRFVSSLNPKLRRDLLKVDPHLPEESLALLTELADVVPEGDLIDALQQIDRAGARMSSQLGILVQKLMRQVHERPRVDAAGGGLVHASGERNPPGRKGRDGDDTPSTKRRLREALREVFERRSDREFNPQPYQRLLEGLSQDELGGESVPSQDRYRDPRDAGDTRLHAAQVAVRTLVHKGGLQHRGAIFERVAADTDLLLRHHKLDAVRAAAISAAAHAESEIVDDATKRSARTLLDGLADENRMRSVIDDATGRGKLTGSARALLARGGVAAVGAILEALSGRLDDDLAQALEQVAAEHAPRRLSRALAWRLERGGDALAPLFGVIRRLQPEAARPLLEEIAARADSENRGRALVALLTIDGPGAADERLDAALDDDDPGFVEIALRALAARETERSTELLGSYVAGDRSGRAPDLGCGMLAARTLSHRGAPGRARLAAALRGLNGSLRPSRVRLAVRVYDLLAAHRDEEGVAGALRAWRRSPASLVGRLLPRRRAGRHEPPGRDRERH
jgi:hypothetical protein